MAIPTLTLDVGQIVAERTVALTRDSLVRYAGASGDFNPIHYRDDVAHSVGLPGVLAHGMLTMGVAATPVIEFLGDPGLVRDYQVRFTRPVPVDPTNGAVLSIIAKVGAINAEAETVRFDLVASFNNTTVLGKAQLVAAVRVTPAEDSSENGDAPA